MSLTNVFADARFALRLLRRSPGFAATLIGILVAGIGVTTAMFSVVVSLVLRPLPYPHPEELTIVWATQTNVDPSPLSLPDFQDLHDGATTFSSMAALEYDSFSLSATDNSADAAEYLPGVNVSGEYFAVMGIAPLRGRLLGPNDDRPNGPRVAVISASLWHRRFGSDPATVGRTIALNGDPYTVVGIAPEGYRFSGLYSNGAEVWTPLAVTNRDYATLRTRANNNHFLHAIGRRKSGVTLAAAGAELSALMKNIEVAHPESNTKVGARVQDMHDALVGPATKGSLWTLFAAIGLVFLVVCANVANLLLARAAARRPEMAARAALGATPGRLAAQLVTETVVVFVLAALGGLALAYFLAGAFAARILVPGTWGGPAIGTLDVHVDGAAAFFAVGIALVFGLVFGLVPAAEASRVEPQTVLKDAAARGASSGRAARLLRGGLVVAQVAIAFVLLAGSGLALRAFREHAAVPLGFDVEGIATGTVVLPAYDAPGAANPSPASLRYPDDDSYVRFHQAVVARLASRPGVLSVGANTSIPMGTSNSSGGFEIEGVPPWPNGAQPLLERNRITPGYFKALGIPILRGRDVTEADGKDGRQVIIIGKTTAERFFPGQDPIGRRIDLLEGASADHRWREIVGVVGDVRRVGWHPDILPEAYVPLAQRPSRWMTFVVRAKNPAAILAELPAIVAGIDPREAVAERVTMESRLSRTLGGERLVVSLLGAFAAAALLLATLGIFGLVSYTTSQRTRELGIRLALGSPHRRVIESVMREGVVLLATGLGAGLLVALPVGRALAARIAGASSFDPLVLGVIVAVLGAAGMLASLLPALRAVRIPPAIALRYE